MYRLGMLFALLLSTVSTSAGVVKVYPMEDRNPLSSGNIVTIYEVRSGRTAIPLDILVHTIAEALIEYNYATGESVNQFEWDRRKIQMGG